ncbi:hypothetical protein H6A33_10430 [Collinsella tanakaei]|nr:hypothetical protein [Collinsella tanakaei]
MQTRKRQFSQTGERLSTVKAFYIYVLVFATILMSKSVYFGILNLSTYRWVYYALIIIGFVMFWQSARFEITGVLRSMGLIALLLINVLFHLGDMTSSMLNELIGFALDLVMVSVMAAYVGKSSFIRAYVDCIVVIALISIPCVVIANVNESLARSLVSNPFDWTTPFGYSLFYTWGINGVINVRNSGVFWEPGAFAGFLIVGILFLLHGKAQYRHAPVKMLILIITLFTTRSTTGYILLVLMMPVMYRDFMSLFTKGKKNSAFGIIVGIVVVFASVLVVVGSGNIVDKMNGVSYLGDGYTNESAEVRSADVVNSLQLSMQAGIMGLGNTTSASAAEASLGIADNSMGLLHLVYTYGWLFALAYYYVFFSGLTKLFSNCNEKTLACIAVIMIVLFATEGLYWLPTYLAIAFLAFGNAGQTEELQPNEPTEAACGALL